MDTTGKFVFETAISDCKIAFLPHDLMLPGMFGGPLLNKAENFAREVAERHAEASCEMECIDFVKMCSPVKKNDCFYCKAAVTKAWPGLVEVMVKIVAEDFRSLERRDILNAYFTFKTHSGDNLIFVPVIPETEEQKNLYFSAEKRRGMRSNPVYTDSSGCFGKQLK